MKTPEKTGTFRRWRAVAYAAVFIATTMICTSPAHSEAPVADTFEGLLQRTSPMTEDTLLMEATDAMGACHCEDEFKKKDCRERAETSRRGMASLFKGRLYRFDLGAGAVELGTFDFKKNVFPATLKGPLKRKPIASSIEGCDFRDVSCEREEDETFVVERLHREVEPEVVVTAAPGGDFDNGVAWRGVIPMPDADTARALKEAKDKILGEAVYRVDGFEVVTVEDRKLATTKALLKKDLAAAVKRMEAKGGAFKDEAQRVGRPRMKCVASVRPGAAVGVVRLKLLGIRLWTEDEALSKTYLVSEPASAVPLEKARAAKTEREAKEQWAREHPSKKIDGWRGLAFGASVDDVRKKYPALAEAPNPPFKDPKPNPEVKTYLVRGPFDGDLAAVNGFLLRFYRDQLFYVVVGFEYSKLDAKTAADMVEQLAPELGPPASQKKKIQPGKSTVGAEVTWDSGPTAARLIFFQPNYADPADVVLHLVDAATQERIEKASQ